MRAWPIGVVGLLVACSSSDVRIVGEDDGRFEGVRVWAQVADLDANEEIARQKGRVEDGAFEFVFPGAADAADLLGVIVHVEQVPGSGCGPAWVEEIDSVQLGPVQVHTRDFTGTECLGLGRPEPEPTTTSE